jgi:hypothetical protein
MASTVAIAKAVQYFLHDGCLKQIEHWEKVATSHGKLDFSLPPPHLKTFSLAGFSLSLNNNCGPYYTANRLPPLIPLKGNYNAAVRAFPVLDGTSLEAQLRSVSGDVETPLEEAYRTIEEQNMQITALDKLVQQLQERRQCLRNN